MFFLCPAVIAPSMVILEETEYLVLTYVCIDIFAKIYNILAE